MKTVFILASLAMCVASVGSRADAQQPMPPYDPAYSGEAVPPGFVVHQSPDGAATRAPASGEGAQGAAPPASASLSADELLIDNGLWAGADIGPCCSICGGGSGCPPEWYLEQDIRILNRSRPRRDAIAFDTDYAGNVFESMSTRSASPDISAVWGMTVGHYFARDSKNRDHFVEFSFWGLNNWDDSATTHGHRLGSSTKYGSLNSRYYYAPGGSSLYGFNYADTQRIEYISATNNYEVNGRFTSRNKADRVVLDATTGKWRRVCQPGMYMSYLYGIRFFQLNEGFQFHSESNISEYDGDTLVSSKNYTGDYNISTHNNLLGFQIGADLIFRQCRWTWGVTSKVGPYVNFSDQESEISAGRALDPNYVRRVAASKHEASLIAEVGFEATYKFRPNLMGRASYDFMWVTGVAMAPDQLQFQVEPVNQVNTNGLAFFQGITLGLEWLW